jgi:hypothetical protein
MAVQYRSTGNVDGTVLGQSASELIGFYGATPVAQPSATAQSAVATTALVTVGSTVLTATDLTSINAVVTRAGALTTLVNQLRSDLVTLGVLKGSN